MQNGNFLSSFLPNLCRLLIPIYDLQKKAKKFKWTEEAEKAFNEIKKLLISPPVLKAPTPNGLFRLKSDTSREGMGGTLLQKQGDEWVVIGYHSKRHPKFKLPTTLYPNYIEHSYSHLVENLYAHKTKTLDAMTVKRKCGRPLKPKPQIPTSKPRTLTAAKNLTT